MAVQNEIIMTKKEFEALEVRQEYLVTKRRQEVADSLKQARGFGDLSENAEYDDAKNEQAILEAEIAQNDVILNNAKVVDENEIDKDKVNVGSVVKVYDKEFDEEISYKIVGSASSTPESNTVSRESPIGAALLGKKVGDEVSVDTPGGSVHLKVLEIELDKDAHR